MQALKTRLVLVTAVVSAFLAITSQTALANDDSGKPARIRQRGIVLTPEDARAIATSRQGFKDLSYLTALTPAVARVLATSKGSIDLTGLQELPVELAASLAGLREEEILLDGLPSISAESLRAIAGGDLRAVWLSGVRRMPEDVFAALLEAKTLIPCGLEELPPKASELLAKSCPPRLWWHRLNDISDAQLAAIVDRASTIALGLKSLTPKQAEILSRCKERLILDSVVFLNAEAARLLTQRKGEATISLGGLQSLDAEAKACLDSHGKVSYKVAAPSGHPEPTCRVEDVAAALRCAMQSAMQAHAVAEASSRAAMFGITARGDDAGPATRVTKGFESVDVPMLRRYQLGGDHDDTVKKALVATEALQRHVMAELKTAKALADSRASDEARNAYGDLAMNFDAVQRECQNALWDVRSQAGETVSAKTGRPADSAMAIVFAFQETANAHLLAEATLLSLRSEPREEVVARCDKAIADWLLDAVPALHKYLGRVEHGEQDREMFDAITKLQDCVLAEFRAVKACAASATVSRAALAPFADANDEYNNVVRPLATAIGKKLQGKPTDPSGRPEPGEAVSPNARVFSDEEWAGVVALLRQQGLVRSPEDARVYFGTFALLKGVFVEKRIAEPSPKQLFGLAKTLSVAFGQMPPEKIETTLRATLQLAKETGTEVASRDTLLSLGK